jgi:dTDP-glucose 4,6-dehydratase
MKTILITGGAGFIGSNFIHYFIKKHDDWSIVNLDALTYAGNLENLLALENHPRYHFVKGDICNEKLVNSLFLEHHFDAVVHFAAESHVDRSISGPDQFIITNVLGTHTLLKVAKKIWPAGDNRQETGNRFIHVLTDEVYGSLGPSGMFTEQTPLSPNSPYSASKAGSDLLVRSYFETFGFPGIVTRCSNNYGPYQFPEKLLPLMIANALNDKPLPVYGDGMNVRDWLYVEDHCSAIDAVLFKGTCGHVYNVGGNNEKHNINIVKLILAELGKSESLITFVKDRLGHDRRYAIDSSKITGELGWKPSVTFEEGIKKTIGWYLENKPWWEKIYKKTV